MPTEIWVRDRPSRRRKPILNYTLWEIEKMKQVKEATEVLQDLLEADYTPREARERPLKYTKEKVILP